MSKNFGMKVKAEDKAWFLEHLKEQQLRLNEAQVKGDWPELRQALEVLAGGAASYGFEQVAEVAERGRVACEGQDATGVKAALDELSALLPAVGDRS